MKTSEETRIQLVLKNLSELWYYLLLSCGQRYDCFSSWRQQLRASSPNLLTVSSTVAVVVALDVRKTFFNSFRSNGIQANPRSRAKTIFCLFSTHFPLRRFWWRRWCIKPHNLGARHHTITNRFESCAYAKAGGTEETKIASKPRQTN